MEFDFNVEMKETGFEDVESLGLNEIFVTGEAVVFLVDARSFIHINADVTESNFDILKSCYASMLQAKLKAASDDQVGLILYNTVRGQEETNYPGVEVLQGVDRPTFAKIKFIESLCEETIKVADGTQGGSSLVTVLRSCSGYFEQLSDIRNFTKRVFLFTADDGSASVAEKEAFKRLVQVE